MTGVVQMRNARMTRWMAVPACCAALAGASACTASQASQAPAVWAARHVSRGDRSWVDMAHQADMAELQVCQYAESTGGSRAVRSAGATLCHDHQAFDSMLTRVAQALKLPLPTHMTPAQTETGDRLSNETGHQFDGDFIGSMMAAHQSMIIATQREIAHGSSPEVVKLARQALPMLLRHLRIIRAAAAAG